MVTRLVKHGFQILLAHSDIRVQNIGDVHRDEGGFAFSCSRSRHERFPATGRAVQQYAAAHFFAELGEQALIEKRAYYPQANRFLQFMQACHILKRDLV